MIFIPAWISNTLLLVACVLAGVQHVRLKRPNPVTNIQFVMMVFSMAMVLVVAFYNQENPWLSWAFFLIGAGSLAVIIRQQRMMPPMKPFE